MMHTNPITDRDRELRDHIASEVAWDDPRLHKITRLRMVGDREFPFLDVTYCHGLLKDGTAVRVELPFSQLRKARWKSELVAHAKRDGVFAAGLGCFDNVSIFID